MVAPQYRSRSKKRKNVRVPGGKSVTHYKKKKPEKHVCGRCAKPLGGVPNSDPTEVGHMSKTEKTPERPYAGVLCGECTAKLFRYQARFEAQARNPDLGLEFRRDLTLEKFLPRTWWDGLAKKGD